jgi:HD-GYP domain-containing protein (c-di-GMP phosphodiesterase class II)
MREKNTRLHSQRVRDFTLLLADRYGVREEQRRVTGLAALLHDVDMDAVDIFAGFCPAPRNQR